MTVADMLVSPQPRSIQRPPPQVSARPARVLVAEDDAEMRKLITWALTRDGYQVLQAADGGQLLERLRPSARQSRAIREEDGDLDAVVTDVRMPGISGLEILRLFRLYDRRTPALVITAFGDEAIVTQAQALGRTGVLAKPFELYELCDAVRGLICRSA